MQEAINMADHKARADERERRDIVSGEVMPENRLIRFAAAPDGTVVPDVAAKLPGRGLWVAASRAAIATAVEKKLFARAAKANVSAASDLPARAEAASNASARQAMRIRGPPSPGRSRVLRG